MVYVVGCVLAIEHAKNVNNDSWRIHQLLCSRANPTHPIHKFGTGIIAVQSTATAYFLVKAKDPWCVVLGNKETLKDIPEKKGVNVRDALLAFHKKNYSASVMKLCIVGKGRPMPSRILRHDHNLLNWVVVVTCRPIG